MTTLESNGTALAVREFSDQQIRTRLEIAKSAGFGLETATEGQLNAVYLLARHYDVDPLIDITLYQGRPWFTIDGRVRLMRRHPEYAGYHTRPLPVAEKDAWGYAKDEIVVECTIRTKHWGDITARGKVSPSEFARQPVAKLHPQEMAEKRAIARASRMAFGQDVPDEEEALASAAERNNPQRMRANAERYEQIFGEDELFTPTREREVDDQSRGKAPGGTSEQLVTSKGHPLWQAWLAAEKKARQAGLEVDTSQVRLPLAETSLRASIDSLNETLTAEPVF